MPQGAGKGHSDEGTNVKVAIAGSTAGLVSRFVIAPLDVIKIRQQLQTRSIRHDPAYRGILASMQTIVRQEGIAGLWKGNVSAEALYVLYGASQFLAYRLSHRLLDSSGLNLPEQSQSFIAGMVAGTSATLASYPLDVLRTRFASQGTSKVYQSIPAAVSHILAHEGLRGFFRGASTAVLQIAPNQGIFFGAYESCKATIHHVVPEEARSGWDNAAAAGTASVIAKTAIYPFDLLRKRLQVQGPTRHMYVHQAIPVYTSALDATKTILRTEGVLGFYRGLTVALIKAAPSSAVTIWVFEATMKVLS